MIWLWMSAGLGPFQQSKQWIEDGLHFDKQSLHILVGFLIFALVLLVFKRKIWLALAAVFAAAMLGEALDIYELIVIRDWIWDDIVWPWHYVDVIDTMSGPVILAAAMRMWGRSFAEQNSQERETSGGMPQ